MTRRSQAYYERLFSPSVLDRLTLLGSGSAARVFKKGGLAIKVPHPFNNFKNLVDREAALLEQLGDDDFADLGIVVPQLFFSDRKLGLVRELIEGTSVRQMLVRGKGALPKEVFEAVFRLYLGVERYRHRCKTVLDFTPANLFVDQSGAVYLIDPGPRIGESPFIAADGGSLDREALQRALAGYLGSIRAPLLLRRHFPPSGRFSVGVKLGPDPKTRVLWKNSGMLARWGLSFSDSDLVEIGGWSTELKALTWMPASRYQDSRGIAEGEAQGDGRCVYAGVLSSRRQGEVMLKGVGPTPLIWQGMKYHQDGRVSLNRTLWETSICDELARLGFDTPEVAAVLTTGATTIDNSKQELPAAIAIRVAHTHDRLGHLARFRHDQPAFEVMLEQIGRRLEQGIGRRLEQPDERRLEQGTGRQLDGPRFSPTNKRHRARFVRRFARNLGRTIGRTDYLNIMAFNPTIGNVRADGHLIDFSTVRFFERTLIDWRFMESAWTTKDHRYAFWKMVPRLIEVLAEGLALDEEERIDLLDEAGWIFKDAYETGYREELFWFLGLEKKPALRGARRDDELALLKIVKALRNQRDRSGRTIVHRFWKQTTRAPCFCLEENLAAFVSSERPEDLADEGTEQLSDAQRELASSFLHALKRCFGERLVSLAPRSWPDRIRPFMEAERLAALVYERSSLVTINEWRSSIESW